MSYSNFKNLEIIKQKFDLGIKSADSLFSNVEDINPSLLLTQLLQENVPLALNINTEKARSEFIIAPVLMEVRRLFKQQVSLFSGTDFSVDETQDLNGYCDFILSASPDQVFIEAPVVCVVEAKNENIKAGYPQCIAEMVAARTFNEQQQRPLRSILGVVTTGSNWRFLKLEDRIVWVDFDEYLISRIARILGIFAHAITSATALKD
ncbi:MAG: hypothetical protein KDJ28_10255 [Candidatus Competibacteraceae bacterium]|nr:hypothetical protein [Candidatus Competibacteraceae bacterium]